jgi:hypothetical protein
MARAGQGRINQGGRQLRSHNAAAGLERSGRLRLRAAAVRAFVRRLQADSKRRNHQSHQEEGHRRALERTPQHGLRLPLWPVFSVIPITSKGFQSRIQAKSRPGGHIFRGPLATSAEYRKPLYQLPSPVVTDYASHDLWWTEF